MEGQDQQGSVITINRKALLHSVQLAAERNLQHEDDASETSIVNGESSTSEESGTSNAQQTIVLKAEHVQRAQKRRREAKKLDKPTKPIEHPVAPMRATITHERTENGRHSLRPKVQTVATENFSSDEFGDEGSDDDFRGSVAKKKRGKAAAKKKKLVPQKKEPEPVVQRAPVAMSAGAVIMQKAGLWKQPAAAGGRPVKKGKSSVRSRLSSKLGKR
eukprot:TRINITY_DN2697_c0_g1_i1.p1 TRINITY_DN2697_c0_g1~~TRINITY_DN2697_c0_g1_i1.p1  ORF type:complete len:217 (-),score=54.92 TRINITY_DN2697_c0_g1_i1:367-1017(-)